MTLERISVHSTVCHCVVVRLVWSICLIPFFNVAYVILLLWSYPACSELVRSPVKSSIASQRCCYQCVMFCNSYIIYQENHVINTLFQIDSVNGPSNNFAQFWHGRLLSATYMQKWMQTALYETDKGQWVSILGSLLNNCATDLLDFNSPVVNSMAMSLGGNLKLPRVLRLYSYYFTHLCSFLLSVATWWICIAVCTNIRTGPLDMWLC